METAIAARDVGKRFRRYAAPRAWTLHEAIVWGRRGVMASDWFWAVRHVSFDVSRGQMLGIVGVNGAGKSTLLRLLGGLGPPDEGSVIVNGRVSGLLNLGVGFHGDLTGRQNVFVEGVISGLTRREIASRFDAIVDFAEIGAFIDSPLRTYSSGMTLRLAFAVAIHTDPDILLIDELLAVGDMAFRRKCLERAAQLRADGCAMVLVSHDLDLIALCDEAVWLDAGQTVSKGCPADVITQYTVAVGPPGAPGDRDTVA